MEQMIITRKQFFGLLAIMAVILAIFCFALYKYDQSRNTNPQTVLKWKTAYSAANRQASTLITQNDTLSAKNTQLMIQQSHFCAELSKAKVNEPLCTQ